MKKMTVDIWSDIRCPFCFIGKRKFDKALEKFTNADQIEVRWHSFQLDPDLVTEPERNPYEYLAARKGISVDEAKKLHQYVAEAAKEIGLQFNLDHSKVANSFRGHLLLQLAGEKNLANEMEEALFQAQFIDEKNIDDPKVLMEAGKSVGLQEDEILTALSSEEMSYKVNSDLQMARNLGINSVPFFIFNDKYAVSGAQPPELFVEVLEKSFGEFSENDHGIQILNSGESCDIDGNCE